MHYWGRIAANPLLWTFIALGLSALAAILLIGLVSITF